MNKQTLNQKMNQILQKPQSKEQTKQQIVNHFQCCICTEIFNKNNRIPRLLSCGHNFCEACLIKYINSNHLFSCPYCKTKHGQLRLALTYKNLPLLNLMDINQIKSQQQKQYTIVKPTFEQIVDELQRVPKQITKLSVKRIRDDENNPFDYDLIRDNKKSMRFYKLIPTFNKLQEFEFYVKFSAHGFQECLSQSINELKNLRRVKMVNKYDEYGRMNDLISLSNNGKQIQFDIQIINWE